MGFKQYYREYVRIWQRENERVVKQYDIAEILGKAYLQCQTGLIAANGFKVAGIYPFNPHVFMDSDFIASTLVEENPTDFMASTRETTTSITNQRIQEDLAQPGCSKDNEVKQSAMTPVSPEEIWPIPQIKSKKSTRGRKPSQAAILTDSSYQKTLQLSLKSIEIKKSTKDSTSSKENVKKRGRKKKLEAKVSNDQECNNSPSFTNSEFLLNKAVIAKEDVFCIFCDRSFSEDTKGEMWIQCLMCEMWAHIVCSGAEKDDYICDYCK